MPSAPPLLRFLRAVHRRLVVVRALERAGVCLAVAAAFAAVLVVAMWWEGRDALVAVAATLSIGALAGIGWGLVRRPRLLDAAIEADRQFDLADLLSTALTSLRGEDPWHHAVVASAERRCLTLSPSAVVLHRLGGRAWGGIGLSAALVLTLGVISSLPRETHARSATHTLSAASPFIAPAIVAPQAPPRASGFPDRGDDDGPRARRDTRQGDDGAGRFDSAAGGSPAPALAGDSSDDPAGAGGGAGRTDEVASPPPAVPSPASSGASERGVVAGGVGGSADDGPGGAGPTGSTAGDRPGDPPASPWSSGTSASDLAAARDTVRSGRLPDSYQDVMRHYFSADRDTGE